jgi:hypothetical protein
MSCGRKSEWERSTVRKRAGTGIFASYRHLHASSNMDSLFPTTTTSTTSSVFSNSLAANLASRVHTSPVRATIGLEQGYLFQRVYFNSTVSNSPTHTPDLSPSPPINNHNDHEHTSKEYLLPDWARMHTLTRPRLSLEVLKQLAEAESKRREEGR